MQVKTKFNVWDTIYILQKEEIKEFEIVQVKIEVVRNQFYNNEINIKYLCDDWYDENKIFATPEDLTERLRDNFINKKYLKWQI